MGTPDWSGGSGHHITFSGSLTETEHNGNELERFSCGQKYCCMLVPTCEGMSEKKNQNMELHKHKTTHKPHYFSPIPSGVFFSLKAFRWTRDKSSINPTV